LKKGGKSWWKNRHCYLFPNWAIFLEILEKKKQKIFTGVWCEHDFVNFLRKGDTEIACVNPPNITIRKTARGMIVR
jgi:hypothetical protein